MICSRGGGSSQPMLFLSPKKKLVILAVGLVLILQLTLWIRLACEVTFVSKKLEQNDVVHNFCALSKFLTQSLGGMKPQPSSYWLATPVLSWIPSACHYNLWFVYFLPHFWRPKTFLRTFICKILTLSMVSIQERFQIKSGL